MSKVKAQPGHTSEGPDHRETATCRSNPELPRLEHVFEFI